MSLLPSISKPTTDEGADGLTETSTVISMPPRMAEPTPGASAGVICPNVQIKILSEDGKKLGWGETGEVCSKSPSNAVRPISPSLPNPRETC